MFLHGHMGSRHRRVHKERGKDQEQAMAAKCQAGDSDGDAISPL